MDNNKSKGAKLYYIYKRRYARLKLACYALRAVYIALCSGPLGSLASTREIEEEEKNDYIVSSILPRTPVGDNFFLLSSPFPLFYIGTCILHGFNDGESYSFVALYCLTCHWWQNPLIKTRADTYTKIPFSFSTGIINTRVMSIGILLFLKVYF